MLEVWRARIWLAATKGSRLQNCDYLLLQYCYILYSKKLNKCVS